LKLPDSATNAGRFSRVAIAVAAGGGLALGIAGLAHADPTPAPSSSAGSYGAPARPGGPGQRTHQPHLDGTVKSIGGGHVMIVDRDGFTRQINIATVPSTVKVGVHVIAVGKVNADGVSLDATSVTVAPARPDGKLGPGGYRGPGGPEGGPGWHGRPGPAPSGSGAPPAPSGNGSAPAPAPTKSS
jgi:hypothetical protein